LGSVSCGGARRVGENGSTGGHQGRPYDTRGRTTRLGGASSGRGQAPPLPSGGGPAERRGEGRPLRSPWPLTPRAYTGRCFGVRVVRRARRAATRAAPTIRGGCTTRLGARRVGENGSTGGHQGRPYDTRGAHDASGRGFIRAGASPAPTLWGWARRTARGGATLAVALASYSTGLHGEVFWGPCRAEGPPGGHQGRPYDTRRGPPRVWEGRPWRSPCPMHPIHGVWSSCGDRL
jgi:hypothetical protein